MFPIIVKLVLFVILLKIDTMPTIITLAINTINKYFFKEEKKMKKINSKNGKDLCIYGLRNKYVWQKVGKLVIDKGQNGSNPLPIPINRNR